MIASLKLGWRQLRSEGRWWPLVTTKQIRTEPVPAAAAAAPGLLRLGSDFKLRISAALLVQWASLTAPHCLQGSMETDFRAVCFVWLFWYLLSWHRSWRWEGILGSKQPIGCSWLWGCHGIAGIGGWYSRAVPNRKVQLCLCPGTSWHYECNFTLGKNWKIEFFICGFKVWHKWDPQNHKIFFLSKLAKMHTGMNICNTVCLYASFKVYHQCAPIFAKGCENSICLTEICNIFHGHSSITELRESVGWNSLQFTGFLIPLTLQLHRVFPRERDLPAVLC